MYKQLKLKIIKKEGQETQLIKLSTVAKVLGYSRSTSVVLKAIEIGIDIVKVGKFYKIHKKDLDRLLRAFLTMNN